MRKHLDWLTRRGRGQMACVAAVIALVPAAAFLTVSTATSAGATTVPGPPSGWTTTYSDSFSGAAGSGVDSGWTYDLGTQYSGTGCTGNWGTGEVESETSSTANVSEDGNGHLNITPRNSTRLSGRARPVPRPAWRRPAAWASR
jgi:hypothetical protein